MDAYDNWLRQEKSAGEEQRVLSYPFSQKRSMQ
jgi:hypothetical protein